MLSLLAQLTTISALSSSLSLARETQTTFNPREGHAWRIAAEAEGSDNDNDDDDDTQGDGQAKHSKADALIPSLLVTD
jgi:hypothetical protein